MTKLQLPCLITLTTRIKENPERRETKSSLGRSGPSFVTLETEHSTDGTSRMAEQVNEEVHSEDVQSTTVSAMLHTFAIKNRLQVLGTHDAEERNKGTEQHQIGSADNCRDDSTACLRHGTVTEEKTRNESQQRHEQRGAFDVVQNVKLLPKRSTEHLQLQCQGENEDREDLLQIGLELI